MNDRDCENCKHHTEKGCDSWNCKFEQGMKRKEIIEMLKVLKEQALKSHNDTAIIDVKKDSFIYVMNVTINSLEIDERYELEYEQAEEIHREKEQAYMQGYEDACKKYRKEPCEDMVSRGVFEQVMWERDIAITQLKELGYGLGEKPKTGRWIKVIDKIDSLGNETWHYKCDKCGASRPPLFDRYCPYCGANMQEGEE